MASFNVKNLKLVALRESSTSDDCLCLDITFETDTCRDVADAGYEVKTGCTSEEVAPHSTSCGSLEEDVCVSTAGGPVEFTVKESFAEHVAETNNSTYSETKGSTGREEGWMPHERLEYELSVGRNPELAWCE